jgi:hypothetical protein
VSCHLSLAVMYTMTFDGKVGLQATGHNVCVSKGRVPIGGQVDKRRCSLYLRECPCLRVHLSNTLL